MGIIQTFFVYTFGAHAFPFLFYRYYFYKIYFSFPYCKTERKFKMRKKEILLKFNSKLVMNTSLHLKEVLKFQRNMYLQYILPVFKYAIKNVTT